MPAPSSPPPQIPPPLELECLKALWRLGDGTVKDVRGVLTERRRLAYTTVMTVLDRLVKRGTIERRKQGRSFIYTPMVERDELRRLAVEDFLDTFFDGSEQALRAFLDGRAVAEQSPALASETMPESEPAPNSGSDNDMMETELL